MVELSLQSFHTGGASLGFVLLPGHHFSGSIGELNYPDISHTLIFTKIG